MSICTAKSPSKSYIGHFLKWTGGGLAPGPLSRYVLKARPMSYLNPRTGKPWASPFPRHAEGGRFVGVPPLLAQVAPAVPPLDGNPSTDPRPVPVRVLDATVMARQSIDVNQAFVIAPAHDSALQTHVAVPVGAV